MDQSLTSAAASPLADVPHAPTLTLGDRLTALRYRWWPDHVLGEILAKRWMETAIPVIVLIGVALALSSAIPNFLSPASLADTGRQAGEIGFIVLGMALVMIVGGIDLSVGSTFALTNFCALYFMHVLKWPVRRRGGGHADVRRAARRRQRRADRLLPAACLSHHADHADHLPRAVRPADRRLLDR